MRGVDVILSDSSVVILSGAKNLLLTNKSLL